MTTTRQRFELRRRTMRRKLEGLKGLVDTAKREWSAEQYDDAAAVLEEIEERAGALVNYLCDMHDEIAAVDDNDDDREGA